MITGLIGSAVAWFTGSRTGIFVLLAIAAVAGLLGWHWAAVRAANRAGAAENERRQRLEADRVREKMRNARTPDDIDDVIKGLEDGTLR